METFTWKPSTATRGSMTPRKLKAQFGDGYAQEAPDGINAKMRPWQLTFSAIHATTPTGSSGANLKDIDDFLDRHDGTAKFLWVQPTPFDIEGPMMFICEHWEFEYTDGGSLIGLVAMFEQRPG
jgi:phage-related protein